MTWEKATQRAPSQGAVPGRMRKVTVQIVELTYTTDWGAEKAAAQKVAKYDPLVDALPARGWEVELETFVLGVSGLVYAHDEEGKTELTDTMRELAPMGAQ